MIGLLAFVQEFDVSVLHAAWGRPAWAVPIFQEFTVIGGGWALLWLLPFVIQRRTRAVSLWLVAAVVLTSSAVNLIKAIVERARPCDALGWCSVIAVASPGGYSFPSGHAAGSFAFAGFVAVRAPRWTLLAGVYAAIVAWSRCVLGVHYPSDVLVGAALGTMIGVVVGRMSRPAYEGPVITSDPA